jgi:hypothetical protein
VQGFTAARPYGLANAAFVYQDALHNLFTDQIGHVHPLSTPNLPVLTSLR